MYATIHIQGPVWSSDMQDVKMQYVELQDLNEYAIRTCNVLPVKSKTSRYSHGTY